MSHHGCPLPASTGQWTICGACHDEAIARLHAALDAAQLALWTLWDRQGVHDDPDCPQDDTCVCPTVALVNDGLRGFTPPFAPTRVRG
jgi:hypothetical protein